MSPRGYISPKATIHHPDFQLGSHVLVSDGVLIYQDHNGGPVKIGASVHLHHAIYIQTGQGGTVTIGAESHIQPRCQLSAYKAPITIGRRCEIAPNCAFYSYNHGVDPHEIVRKLPLQSKGGIVIGDDVWLGYGVIVLDGVRIGKGAVIGAGAVVTRNIPEGAIAVGNPARVLKYRRAVSRTETNGSTKAF
ncbi:acyltransferase [bacterium]|nr:acyltransferase [bacterium]